jgi:hypothetical protein
MGAIPEQSFTVRVPAWWDDKAEYVLADYPGREVAMARAGHDWDVCERQVAISRRDANGVLGWKIAEGYVEHFRSDNGHTLRIGSDSFERIPNRVPRTTSPRRSSIRASSTKPASRSTAARSAR